MTHPDPDPLHVEEEPTGYWLATGSATPEQFDKDQAFLATTRLTVVKAPSGLVWTWHPPEPTESERHVMDTWRRAIADEEESHLGAIVIIAAVLVIVASVLIAWLLWG